MNKRRIVLALIGVGGAACVSLLSLEKVVALSAPPLVVSEVMVTGCEDEACVASDEKSEYVVVHNPHDEAQSFDGWRVEALYGTEKQTKIADLAEITGTVSAGGSVLIAFEGYDFGREADFTFQSGHAQGALQQRGYVQIVDADDQVIDRFGWGDVELGDEEVEEIPAGNSTKRLFEPGDDDTYFIEYETSQTGIPPGGGFAPNKPETFPCEQLMISEVLPQPPSGESQFVELYNPTDEAIPLEGCGVQRDGRLHIHWFQETEIVQPGEYLSFDESETGVALTKTVSGTVYFLNQEETELQTVTYPEMDENQAWAWFGGDDWRGTYTLTPHKENVYESDKPLAPCPEGQERSRETNRCRTIGTDSGLKPCLPGQERNPATNRCRKVGSSENDLKPCSPGQERNPETNRCRSTSASSSALKPCKAGQERNPETNRCRKTGGNESNLKPCAPNQERNPETNRCRKKTSLASAAAPVDDITSTQENATAWWAAGAAVASVAGYGIWEWRRSIASVVGRILGRSTGE